MTKMMVCECGLAISDRRGGHRRSVYHLQHRRIKALLSKNWISYSEIGAGLGITRERVRQIAEKIGSPSGHQRQEQYMAERRASAWRERKGHREVIAKCEELGYTVTPSKRVTGSNWYLEANIAVINGKRVRILFIRHAYSHYLKLRRPATHADFYVAISPIGFFIFPSKVWGTFPAVTTFSPDPCANGRGATHSRRHDYLNYLEAWELLKVKGSLERSTRRGKLSSNVSFRVTK
jgi:hypothetical protein